MTVPAALFDPRLPNFTPRVLGDFVLSITTDQDGEHHARWYRAAFITSVGVEGREILFRVAEDENALGYCAGRMAEPADAKRELFELLRLLDSSTEPEKQEG